ncbi:MAG: ABC transporter ATP-binding protein [Oscillospiraceae bacterium]|nr:ABC transporter ATP-binding protein [Oscillospiraceae bacterium]
METQKVLLSVKDLHVNFRVRGRELSAIRGISLDFYAGECVAIVGESGSGKSVFTKTFSGMLEKNGYISGGSITFYADGPVELSSLHRNRQWEQLRGGQIATVFQDPMSSLNPVLTIGKQITSVIRKHRRCSPQQAKALALQMMEKVGIPQPEKRFDDYPFQYSGGMRQRIVIAIALACHPKILICDEPTTALDVTIQAQILKLLKDLQKELGFTIIFITHDLGVVANIADRVAVLYAGQMVELGTAEDIFYDPRHPYTWALLQSLPQLAQPGSRLYSIPGTPPSLYSQLQGDPFAPRNPYCLKIDTMQQPPMFQVTDTHFAKTWLLDPRAPKIEKPEALRDLHKRLGEEFGSYG